MEAQRSYSDEEDDDGDDIVGRATHQMQSGDGVGPVLGHDDGLVVQAVPGAGLLHHVVCDLLRLARARVPAVVAVEADHVQVTTLYKHKVNFLN